MKALTGDELRATCVPRVFAIALPYPPSMNHLWRRVGNRTLKSEGGRIYEERCAKLVWAALREPDTWHPSGPLCLLLMVHPPDRRRRDLDNVLKASQDALCRGLAVDDSTIAELHIYRRTPEPHDPHVFVMVSPATTYANEFPGEDAA